MKHLDELRVVIDQHKLHIIDISESKIDDSIGDNEIHVEGY